MANTYDGVEAIEAALREVERALRSGWRKPNGDSAEGNLRKLRESLLSAQALAAAGREVREPGLVGATKWVADWIPDLKDPLLAALDKVELSTGAASTE